MKVVPKVCFGQYIKYLFGSGDIILMSYMSLYSFAFVRIHVYDI